MTRTPDLLITKIGDVGRKGALWSKWGCLMQGAQHSGSALSTASTVLFPNVGRDVGQGRNGKVQPPQSPSCMAGEIYQ